ncbi:hypothetical protein, variant 2 [Cryptococcus amylolentus CBS 6039]|nr:hypothetical protein, variant 2 [Cryptococcus amylolentus CBS 6039]ODN84722.1 hypothetical protein, variant 2 [Cryptococcus amylolentus CBS 6039]
MTTAQRPIQPLSNPSPYASAPESSPEVSASAPSAFVPSVSYPSHPQAAPKFSSMVDYDDFTSDFGGLNTPPATVDAASSLVNGDASRGGDKGEINTGSSTAGLDLEGGNTLASGSLLNPHISTDQQYPYANLLASEPPNHTPSQYGSSLGGTPTYQSYHQDKDYINNSLVGASQSLASQDAAGRAQTARQHHRVHPYQTSTADVLSRHTSAKAHWDDVSSPDQDVSSHFRSANSSAANTPAAGPSTTTTAANTPNSMAKPSGRSGQKRRQKYTRTRTGCLCCRSRRIKCDETRPICKRCVIAKKECVYPEGVHGSGNISSSREDKKGKGRSSGEDSESEADMSRSRPGTRPGSPSGSFFPPQTALAYPYGGSSRAGGSNAFDGSALNVAPISGGLAGSSMGGGMGLMEMGLNMNLGMGQQSPSDGSALNVSREGFAADASKQAWGADQGGAPMLATPNFLLPWFPTAEERSLILHYCANAASLMMAIPSGLNPLLAINLPLALDSPRGMNPSADALRVALLGIGAIHQAFLLARSGVSNSQTAAMFQYASTLRETGKEMVRRAARTGATDAALGASTAFATIDIFFGGANWQDNFALAKEMVSTRGGPSQMLKDSTPTALSEGVTVSPARLMLEILAIYETFGCLTSGDEPTMIPEHGQNWWLEANRSMYEEHSVEKQFGMSRVMVLLLNRLTRLINRVAKAGTIITEQAPSTNASSNSFVPTPSSTPGINSATDEVLIKEARQLNKDVDIWIESLQMSTLEHERVQVGNRAYAHAMKILLLRRIFKYPREDARVQRAAQQVLQHCSWSTAALGMSIDLTWPAIIGGCCVDGSSRQWVTTLLEGFKSQCCFDIDSAARIISEVWRRVDAGERRTDWKEVCDDLGLHVL